MVHTSCITWGDPPCAVGEPWVMITTSREITLGYTQKIQIPTTSRGKKVERLVYPWTSSSSCPIMQLCQLRESSPYILQACLQTPFLFSYTTALLGSLPPQFFCDFSLVMPSCKYVFGVFCMPMFCWFCLSHFSCSFNECFCETEFSMPVARLGQVSTQWWDVLQCHECCSSCSVFIVISCLVIFQCFPALSWDRFSCFLVLSIRSCTV